MDMPCLLVEIFRRSFVRSCISEGTRVGSLQNVPASFLTTAWVLFCFWGGCLLRKLRGKPWGGRRRPGLQGSRRELPDMHLGGGQGGPQGHPVSLFLGEHTVGVASGAPPGGPGHGARRSFFLTPVCSRTGQKWDCPRYTPNERGTHVQCHFDRMSRFPKQQYRFLVEGASGHSRVPCSEAIEFLQDIGE